MSSAFVFVFVVLFSFRIEPLMACSCRQDIPLQQHFNMSNQVFIGTAVDVTDNEAQMRRRVVFRVEENFKGILSTSGLITIFTHTMESACGLGIQKDERWQIWAHKSYSNPNEHETNWCSLSTKNTQENIFFLRQPILVTGRGPELVVPPWLLLAALLLISLSE